MSSKLILRVSGDLNMSLMGLISQSFNKIQLDAVGLIINERH